MFTTIRRSRTALAAVVCLGIGSSVAGCGSSSAPTAMPSAGGTGSVAAPGASSSYDSVVKGAPVADAATIKANPWASKIKKQGYLRVGGTDSSPLFSMRDINTGQVTGFDAGLSQMLARYITGGSDIAKLTKLTNVTVDTRETLLENHSVDAVFATYTITPARAKKVAFAGPYYSSGDAIMVKASNNTIKTVADLKGKTVATEQNSTAALDIKKFVPSAKVQLFQTNDECVAAVQQGRVDAYVLDQSILISSASTNKSVKVVGKPFTKEPYGIGLSKDEPAAKKFVDSWLKKIEANGDWAKLWKATVGTVVKGSAPKPPAVGS